MPIEIPNGKKSVPDGLWTKCKKCEEIIYNKELESNFMICPKCGYYFRLNVWQRLDMLLEKDTFSEAHGHITSSDPLNFSDSVKYVKRVNENKKKTGLKEAVVCGEGKMGSHRVAICVLEFGFMGGSMASAVGEKITRTIETAIKKRIPLIIVSSSGGARMQEGILSLMQMAKTSAALARLEKNGIPFISVLSDPTTGGVTASFGMLGDIIIAEPHALIGFAGPRVIEQTIRQKLPPDFQKSEFLLKHGMIDMIVERKDLKDTLIRLLEILRISSQ